MSEKKESILITGGAGFIGSNLARRFNKQKIIILDNLTNGSEENLRGLDNYLFFNIDLSNFELTLKTMNKINKKYYIKEVWHLAANSDIPAGIENSNIDLKNTFLSTYNTFYSLSQNPPEKILFSSSSAVYGDFKDEKLFESSGPLLPISNYGSMKLSSEAFLSSWVEKYNSSLYIFRFPNVVGSPATHGVIFDFINKLLLSPKTLNVLGNGLQKKPYLYISELLDAMLHIRDFSSKKRQIFNIGPNDNGIEVREIAEIICSLFEQTISIKFEKQERGWIGDIPKFNYDLSNLKNIGWNPKLSSKEAIKKAAKEIYHQIIAK